MVRKMMIGGVAGLVGGIVRVMSDDIIYMMLISGAVYYALDKFVPKKEEVSDAN